MLSSTLGRSGTATKGPSLRRSATSTVHTSGQCAHTGSGTSNLLIHKRTFQKKRIATKTEASASVVADVLAAAVPSNVNPLLVGTTGYSCTLLLLMLAAPFSLRLRQFFRSTAMFLPLVLAYFILLVQAWTPETWSLILPGNIESGFKNGFNPQFFPKLSGIMHLFSQPVTIASFWVHIVTVNLVFARTCLLDGLNKQVPTWHTVLLSAVFGPLGVVSHILTLMTVSCYRFILGRDMSGEPRPAVLKTNSGGTITILPY